MPTPDGAGFMKLAPFEAQYLNSSVPDAAAPIFIEFVHREKNFSNTVSVA